MIKKLLLAIVMFIATMGFAFADVDVNKGDQAALDGIKGIGPKISQAILDERKKGGNFKDWADFESRVKGIGEKSSMKLSQAGLTVNGQAKPNAPAAPAPAPAAASVKPAASSKPAQAADTDSKADKKAKAKEEKAAKVAEKADKKAKAKADKDAEKENKADKKVKASVSASAPAAAPK